MTQKQNIIQILIALALITVTLIGSYAEYDKMMNYHYETFYWSMPEEVFNDINIKYPGSSKKEFFHYYWDNKEYYDKMLDGVECSFSYCE